MFQTSFKSELALLGEKTLQMSFLSNIFNIIAEEIKIILLYSRLYMTLHTIWMTFVDT